jgi:hypothetical protein
MQKSAAEGKGPVMANVFIKVILAAVFLCIGAVMLYVKATTGQLPPPFDRDFVGINPGWLAIIFGVINLLRAWIAWIEAKRRRGEPGAEELLRQRWQRPRREPRPEQPPDPNFQFTDEPGPKP